MKDRLGTRFEYLQDIPVGHTEDGEPDLGGCSVRVQVLGQDFAESFAVAHSTTDKTDVRRKEAELFGRALERIGRMIRHQALYGEHRVIEINGQRIVYF
jgi:hypothetical protein